MSDPLDPRAEVRAARHALAIRWGALAAGILLLLSLFSAGFFLYAALVVGGLLLAAVAVASASRAGIAVRRRLDRTEIEMGEAVDASVSLHNAKGLPAPWIFWRDQIETGIDVEGETCAFETLPARGEALLTYRLHSTRRGLFRIGPAVVEASGPFGLVRRFRVEPDVRFLTVYPRTVALGQGWPLGHQPIHQVPRRRSLFEDPSRFLGVRPFRPGDGLRRIHWRATARSGELQVKVFEPAVLAGALIAVEMGSAAYPNLKEGEPEGDLRVEAVITAAASLADFVLAGGQQAALLSNGADAAERYPEDWSGGTFRRLDEFNRALATGETRRRITGHRPVEVERGKGAWQRERLRSALARLTPAPAMPLAELLTLEIPRLPRSLVLMIVTPDANPALGAALESLHRSGIETGVVWVRPEEDSRDRDEPAAGLPEGVPVWAIRGDADLELLGSARL
ncbi:MAG TPA: DUF58 domain-containing protein [Thermoanaerobaculia bacterium]|jgi:uncharacterized protein (DUF58 family)|nr:DUF58 domain-containing protein [Thermoanaerobaculia bacterium]